MGKLGIIHAVSFGKGNVDTPGQGKIFQGKQITV